MTKGLLEVAQAVEIRLDANREILSASDEVFRSEHQDESRTLIAESEILSDYLDAVGFHLKAGDLRFATVTEAERETAFQYDADGTRTIRLTRAHQGLGQFSKP